MKKIRFGILGSGFMGRTHAEAVRRLLNAELIAIAGGSRAPGLAVRYGVSCEPDYQTLLRRRDIDAVVVTTPHHVHVQETLAAFKEGKHVLVEKPMATTVADSDQMIAAAKAAKLTLAVGYQQRFRVNNVKARTIVQEGIIGQIQAALISMPLYAGTIKAGGFGGNWAWWNDPTSVGHLINSAPHALDILRWFTGAEIVTVSAFSRTLLPDLQVEDTTMGLLELSNGAICSVFSSRALAAPSFPGEDFRIRIMGSKGLLDLDPYGELKHSDAQGWRLVSQQPAVKHEGADTAFADVRMQAYCDQLQAFIASIEGRPSQVGTGEDGRAAVAAVVAMLKSSADKCWISPPR